ncbi:xanthine dehydrogenase family protein molybdopterin-binding subunit [Chryseolinea sp. H1M3-3]|uniref:xanthine dehydrogenase family protein molybdopterin-binding subunit n=1 Tax=Chryseolinea sp. H1M3-3 TaxID=3034144 RepID=UPI0023EC13AD|nr:xanthine dehydrogenase family protein molybdopterin-binding subunit [Chryseolinea sp. H1M3-3]
MDKKAVINRRDFIKAGTLVGGGILISMAIPFKDVLSTKSAPPNIFSPNAFLRIGEDDSIVIILSKVEMGQGIWTTLPMLMAEELDCDWKKIKVEHSPPGTADDFLKPVVDRFTGGSETTVSQFDIYRQAGATARIMLINAAANRWGVKPEICSTENGYVIAGNKKLSFGKVANDASVLPKPVVKLREPQDWKYIGKSQKRLDSLEKINGKAKYGMDIQFPDLLTAVVAHAPVMGGKVKSFNAEAAKAIEGVRHIVQIPTGISVLADNFWAAQKGRDALTIEWERGENENIESKALLDEYVQLSKTKGQVVKQKGDVTAGLKKANKSIEAEFSFPFLAHAPMEPLNCTVKIEKDKCEVWAGTQAPKHRQAEVAVFLGLQPEQVLFHTPHLGGSFGRRGTFSSDWIMEAVHIAKASGQFIKLVWTREDDIKGGYYRPVYLHRVNIGIGTDGYPVAWQHRIVGQSLFTGTPLEEYIVQNGIDYSSVTTAAPYSDSIPHCSFELITTHVEVPVSAWRSVGHTHTAFVMETLVDELATIAKIDPVEYRRSLFKNSPRHLAALNLAAEKAEWSKPMPEGRFRGIAVHEAMGSYVSQVVEISIDDNKLQVHRVVCAIDCGLAVNPDGVHAQMEGCIVYGLTAALYGEITMEKGQVQQSNFHDYQMLRMNQMPEVEVYIVPSSEKMGGAGEPGVPPIAPALANALFAATGNRVRRLPIQKADLIKSDL